jgi:hypothetical protein
VFDGGHSLMIACIFYTADIDSLFFRQLQEILELIQFQIVVDHQSFLNEFFIVSGFEIILDLHEVFLYPINFFLDVTVLNWKPLDESE